MHPLVFASEHRTEIPIMKDVYGASPYEQSRRIHDSKTSTAKSSGQGKQQTYKSSRGRPRADVVSSLILNGSAVKGKIRCNICHRIFPREKSLQAHMRTHTGERPYACDFPGCSKAFCQSGQLKTHQRLHTGEKPFACCVEGCSSRFTHANRHCSAHPYAGLRRVETHVTGPEGYWDCDDHAAIQEWLNKQVERKQARSPAKHSRSVKREQSMDDPSDEDYVSGSQSSRTSQSDISQEDDVIGSPGQDDVIGSPGQDDVTGSLGQDDVTGSPGLEDDVTGSPGTIPRELDDQQDKWIGAWALIELASGFHYH